MQHANATCKGNMQTQHGNAMCKMQNAKAKGNFANAKRNYRVQTQAAIVIWGIMCKRWVQLAGAKSKGLGERFLLVSSTSKVTHLKVGSYQQFYQQKSRFLLVTSRKGATSNFQPALLLVENLLVASKKNVTLFLKQDFSIQYIAILLLMI